MNHTLKLGDNWLLIAIWLWVDTKSLHRPFRAIPLLAFANPGLRLASWAMLASPRAAGTSSIRDLDDCFPSHGLCRPHRALRAECLNWFWRRVLASYSLRGNFLPASLSLRRHDSARWKYLLSWIELGGISKLLPQFALPGAGFVGDDNIYDGIEVASGAIGVVETSVFEA